MEELAARAVRLARETGSLTALPLALNYRASVHVHAGEFDAAATLIEEADRVSFATGYSRRLLHRHALQRTRPIRGSARRRTTGMRARRRQRLRLRSDVTTLFDGGSDEAGFVQVMKGAVKDRAKADALENPEMLAQLRAARPDLLFALRVWFDRGTFAGAAYFTSEADARKGESSTEFSGPQQEYANLLTEMTFLDIRDPQFSGPN